MKEWPTNKRETVDFEEIVKPLRKAVGFAYDLTRKNVDKDIPTDDRHARATVPSIDETFNVEGLEYHAERDRDPMEVILTTAVQLGIEQGMRILRKEMSTFLDLVIRLEEDPRKRQFIESLRDNY